MYQRLFGKHRFSLMVNYAVILSLLLASCGSASDSGTESNSMNIATAAVEMPVSQDMTQSASDTQGLNFVLSEGKELSQTVESLPVAETQPLAPELLQALLGRLPVLETETGDVQDFRLPAETLKPPRPGVTIEQSFPPTVTTDVVTPEVTSGPLQVVRYAPEGAIKIAPFLQVTFNQPMVPLATLDQLKEEEVPVKITPNLPGVWKWIGTKTLVFEYKPADEGDPDVDRFPKATDYTAEVPAGTKSATGSTLDQAVTWHFSTPPATLQYSYPYSYQPQPRNPVLFASFDQKIDPAAVLATTTVNAGGEQYQLQLIPDTEARSIAALQGLIKQAGEGRWLAFRADKEFPADTTVNVAIGPNTPSAEGPLTNPATQGFSFQTYAPLRVTDYNCGYSNEPCPPGSPFNINFNNTLDQATFAPDQFTVSPEIPGVIVENYGSSVGIRGATVGRTTYKVTVSADVQDIFGQKLGKEQVLEFQTGSANPILNGPNGGLITVDPTAQKPGFTFFSINYDSLRVRVYSVTPADWPAYMNYLRDYWNTDTPPTPPGKEVMNTNLRIGGEADSMTETTVDLSDLLQNGKGQLLVVVDVPQGIVSRILGNRDRSVVQSWVQSTQIGLDAFTDHSELVAWATDLNTGAPLQGVKLSLSNSQISATSDEKGVARVDLPSAPSQLLIGEMDGDLAILPNNTYDYWGGSGYQQQSVSDELRWYVFDDRQMYRPTEEAHVKGWLRLIGGKQDGDVGLPSNITGVRYQVVDPQGNTLVDQIADVNVLAGFDFNFTLPEGVNLGTANISLAPVGGYENFQGYHSFQIQEFRRPEFEVSAQNEGTGPYVVGDEALVSVSAQYYAGGPLPNAQTDWTVNASPSSYSPPGWDDFIFGKWTPWWSFYDYSFSDFGYRGGPGDMGTPAQSYTSKTDAAGKQYLRMQFLSVSEPQPYSLNAEARVMDVNRQAWASSTNLLVHPAATYVGLRSDRTFVEKGQPLKFDVIATNIDGKAEVGRSVKVTASRMEWKFEKGKWNKVASDVQECTVESAAEPVECSFDTTQGGEYQIVAQVRDDRERLNQSELTSWVSGGKTPARRNVEQEQLTLIPDKQSYQPGDTAEVLVQAPWSPAEGLLTVARSGFLYTERFTIEDGTATLKIPIKEEYTPNVNIQVDLNGSAPRTDDAGNPLPNAPTRPAFATGSLSLAIPPLSRTLKVEAVPAESKVSPGAETSVAITLTDAAGKPVEGGEVALVVVDEAVLALTGYNLADPVAAFYSDRGSYISSVYGRSSIQLINPEQLAAMMAGGLGGGGGDTYARSAAGAAPMMDMAQAAPAAAPMATEAMPTEQAKAMDAGQAQAPIAVRSNFNPLALFSPAVTTDADGKATATIKLPDNLTRYRVMAVAVADGKYFGKAEANLTARLPLMVRPSAPRFLNFGDFFLMPVVVQNQTDAPMQVDVALRASNLNTVGDQQASIADYSLAKGLGVSVTVPANDRVEVVFPATTNSAGTVRMQIAAASGEMADAATVDLPVYTPATTEAFAVYGVVDEGAIEQPIAKPENVFPQFGGLEVQTSSTAVQALTDAVLYLTTYPFECTEQISSRILGIASLRDVLTAFKAEGLPSPEELEKSVDRDIARLQQMQNSDGGFPVWQRGDLSIPYYSIHVTHALQRAKMKGYTVPPEMMSLALQHLRSIESYYPSWYSEQTKHVLSSYAVYVRNLMGDKDTTKARTLINQYPLDQQSLEAIAWLWQVLSDDSASTAEVQAIRQHINNRAVETAGAANFTTSYGDQEYVLLHSNRRTDGIILDALINDQPDSDLIPKVVAGLLAHRVAGRWDNTQENAFILLALDRYFNTFEAQTPDFVARIWLGETYVGEHAYQGRTTERNETVVPMSYLVGNNDGQEPLPDVQSLVLSKEGEGRLYYRLGLRYAPSDLNMPPLDMGFVVQRSYEPVDKAEDVTRDQEGIWHIKAGARVRVRIKMVADNRRYNVALVDPLPAGLEIINPALAVSENIPADPGSAPYGWWWGGTWYEHQNLRDQRAEAFTTLLWDGVYDYDYVARATTRGTYVVPPAKAEEMYSPEVFGRSGIDQVVVE